MIKKSYYILIVFIILMLLFNIVSAHIAPDKTVAQVTAEKSYNTMVVSLNIDYGRASTQDNYVTLNLNVSGQNVDSDSLKVQFSSDNKNWKGYNLITQKWEDGLWGVYQSYYSGFYIGTGEGLKTVYAKVMDSSGNTGLANAKINYSPYVKDPHIVNPQSTELGNPSGSLSDAGIKSGSGSLYDPYITSKNNTRLISKMPNVAEICYYTDQGSWSPWFQVASEQANIPIVFNNVEGLKEVRLRTKNKYGVEGDTEIIYYLLDYTNPTVNLHTDYHSFIAVDGKLQFDLEVNDNLAGTLDLEVEVLTGGSVSGIKGKIAKYEEDKPTITSIMIDGLPEGSFNLKATVTDEAGNKGIKQIYVNSII